MVHNNVLCMLFKLPLDCSASDMFVMAIVPTCPALTRKLVLLLMSAFRTVHHCAGDPMCGRIPD